MCETSRGFHLRVMDHPVFQRGDISIQWLEQTLDELTAPSHSHETLQLAALTAALLTDEERMHGRRAEATRVDGATTGHAASADRRQWTELARRDALRSS